jgi:UDP:flavonoid glycosyltransferase YjiC (YdhE family)
VHLPTYSFEEEDLVVAIDRMLKDEPLRRRMKAASTRLQARPGTHHAADLIEGVAARAERPGLSPTRPRSTR